MAHVFCLNRASIGTGPVPPRAEYPAPLLKALAKDLDHGTILGSLAAAKNPFILKKGFSFLILSLASSPL